MVNLSLPWWALWQYVRLVLLLWKVQKLKSPWKNRFFKLPRNIILLSKKAPLLTPSYNIYEHKNLVTGFSGDPVSPSTLHRPFLEIQLPSTSFSFMLELQLDMEDLETEVGGACSGQQELTNQRKLGFMARGRGLKRLNKAFRSIEVLQQWT